MLRQKHEFVAHVDLDEIIEDALGEAEEYGESSDLLSIYLCGRDDLKIIKTNILNEDITVESN